MYTFHFTILCRSLVQREVKKAMSPSRKKKKAAKEREKKRETKGEAQRDINEIKRVETIAPQRRNLFATIHTHA